MSRGGMLCVTKDSSVVNSICGDINKSRHNEIGEILYIWMGELSKQKVLPAPLFRSTRVGATGCVTYYYKTLDSLTWFPGSWAENARTNSRRKDSESIPLDMIYHPLLPVHCWIRPSSSLAPFIGQLVNVVLFIKANNTILQFLEHVPDGNSWPFNMARIILSTKY